ncbi:ThuA domain-containing protein [Leifsonia poae]|uniref:ThuA domain-containing protein n=1 Tax=Leifsonia poae TaxID=110933 RepID=UPI001CBE2D01|nr:ThuA domain-containing protein [Leifsonia poae]
MGAGNDDAPGPLAGAHPGLPDRHPIVAGLGDFEVDDERYTYLRTAPDLVPLATHEHEGVEYPLLWARTYGDARIVYDALGHDAASFASPTHRTIIARAAHWLTD